jgi:hypothetical protein
MDSGDREQPRRRWLEIHILLFGLQLSIAFILLLLIIVNADEPVDSSSYLRSIFLTRRSYFLYETLIAGLLGAYLGEIFRLSTTGTRGEQLERGGRFAATLFLGGAAAIVVGVLFPLVVLGQFEGPKINSWTLVLAGGIAGNQARSALSKVEDVIARMLASFHPSLDTTVIADSVTAGVQKAFAGPEPVKYQGFVAMNVVRNHESVLKSDANGSRIASLQRNEPIEVEVQFATKEMEFGPIRSGIIRPLNVSRGDETSALVPFRLLVDFGFAELAPVEREITVPRNGKSLVETFAFTVPEPKVTSDPTKPEDQFPSQISVSVYQHSRYFDSCVVSTSVI